jgi:hypothetical protein
MNSRTLVNVARYLLIDRFTYTALPWAALTFSFLVNLVIYAGTRVPDGSRYTGGLASIYLLLCVVAALGMGRGLPFGLTLGVTRRAYYAGTALLAVTLAAIYGLALTILQLIEQATNGWGVAMHFFRVPYILAGPWYLTWLTSFVGLVTLFVYGMWFGIIYRRWSLIGILTFVAAQIVAALIATLVITRAHDWTGVGHFFTPLTTAGLIGLLAPILLAGGFATIRRATV